MEDWLDAREPLCWFCEKQAPDLLKLPVAIAPWKVDVETAQTYVYVHADELDQAGKIMDAAVITLMSGAHHLANWLEPVTPFPN